MSRPRTYKTNAVVLKQTPLGEADRILTLFTPDQGKVRAVAKGVRRTNSRQGGHLELLNLVSVSLSVGRNLDIVNESDIIRSFREFKEDLQRVSQAIYIAELTDSFATERASVFPLYELLLHTLDWLSRAGSPDLLVRYFELHLLDVSGYRPEIFSCVECRTELQPGDHTFSSAHGGVLCPTCRATSDQVLVPLSLGAMKVLRFILRAPGYGKVDALTVSPGHVGEIERLLRTYIRYIVEKDLKSAEFMHLVSSSEPRPAK